MTWPLAGAVAAAVAFFASPLVLMGIRDRIIDVPNERSSHSIPTPRGGGLALIAGTFAGLLALQTGGSETIGLVIVAGLLGALGWAEDLRSIPVGYRLAAQTLVAGLGLVWLLDGWSGGMAWLVIFFVGCMVWIIGYTNAFNFMDGINGISGAQLIVAGATWTVVGTIEGIALFQGLGAITVGGAIGYLPWNFPNAKFFIGDVGALFAGGWLASVAVIGIRLDVPVAAVIAPLLIYGIDTTVTLVRKVRSGKRWNEPHKSHVYQRLVGGGWSHARATTFYAATAAVAAVSGLGWLADELWITGAAALATAGAVGLYLAAPGLFATRSDG